MVSGRAPSIVLCGGLAALCGAAGCATTGLAWVHEPESGVDLSPPSDDAAKAPRAEMSAVGAGALPAAFTGAPQGPPAPRRLDHTITLGETTALTASSGEAIAPPGGAQSPVIINIYVTPGSPAVYGPAYGVAIGGVGTGFPRFAGARSQAARAVAMRPGLDWAPPPSYGPAFPYRMGPSSPWTGDGSERSRSSR